MLEQIRIASLCSADWERMAGDDRVRFCSQCNLNVFNFSEMTTAEVEQLVATTQGRLCGRFFRRSDGTMLTQDCPVGFHARFIRVSRVAGAALSAAMGLSFAVAQKPPATNPSLIQIENAPDGIGVEVVDSTSAVIAGATVRVVDSTGQTRVDGVTTAMGRVKFPGLVDGQYTVEASAPGFRTTRETVAIFKRGGAKIRLILDVAATMGVIVTVDENFRAAPSLAEVDDFLSVPVFPTLPAAPRLRGPHAIGSVNSYPFSNID